MQSGKVQIWLFNKNIDIFVLGAPVWLILSISFFLSAETLSSEVPLWVWVCFVLGIDVSHVWSTLFRTYLDKQEFERHRKLLISAPVVCVLACFSIALFSTTFFWTVLAYVALYHFIKQQFGFMQLYRARHQFQLSSKKINDKFVIYLGMLYPVVHWHFSSERKFAWFVDGDFFNFHSLVTNLPWWNPALASGIENTITFLYFVVLMAWLIEEVVFCQKNGVRIPIGKWLWVITTWANWYLGIVFFNSDIVFTMTNVIAHGIPYMALTFYYIEEKRKRIRTRTSLSLASHLFFMIFMVLILAYGEEYLWDILLYRENEAFFGTILGYPGQLISNPFFQALALSVLTLPQATHYILDGYIWKSNEKNPDIKPILIDNHG